MKSLFIIAPLILLNGCTSGIISTAVTAAHTGTNIYCGSLTQEERLQFRNLYNQDSQHRISIQCAADSESSGESEND